MLNWAKHWKFKGSQIARIYWYYKISIYKWKTKHFYRMWHSTIQIKAQFFETVKQIIIFIGGNKLGFLAKTIHRELFQLAWDVLFGFHSFESRVPRNQTKPLPAAF